MLVLPYHPAERAVPPPDGFDGTHHPEGPENIPKRLDMNAIGMIVDLEQMENRRECKVNEYDALLCELGDRSYLCWTLSPEISCMIEYSKGSVEEASIFRMAESVPVP